MRRLLILGAGAAALAMLPARAPALDGNLQVRNTVQQGRSDSEFYRQNILEMEGSGNQRVPFGRSVFLGLDGRMLRQLYKGHTGAVNYDMRRDTGQGGASINFVGHHARLGLEGILFRQRSYGPDADAPSLNRRQLGLSGNLTGSFARLGAGSLLTYSRQGDLAGSDLRNQEWSGWLDTRALLGRSAEFGYRFSGLTDRDLTAQSRTTQITNTLSLSGTGRFAGNRGTASANALSTFFNQEYRREGVTTGGNLQVPLSGGYRLDDTPEEADPLEAPLTPVPELFDHDRTTPTDINIGDSASRVRDFGGDYRNIRYDFGEPVDIQSATLYVDRTLLSAAFFRWRVFVSNDPEGRAWTELAQGRFAAQYREWGTGQQGWTVSLSAPVSARYFKMVDQKLGPTVDDLFVTELEVYTQRSTSAETDRSKTTTWRLDGALGYNILPSVHAGYDLFYDRHTAGSGAPGALEQWTHGFSAGWRGGLWSAAGRATLGSLSGVASRNTRSDGQNLSIRRGRSNAVQLDLALDRVRESGQGADRTSKTASLGADWPAAPALRFRQRLSVGRLTDKEGDLASTSLATATSVTGQPVPAVTVDLGSTERWVSREAGAGYSRFNDTAVNVVWHPAPFVSFESQLQYQLRDTSDWITRNTVSWTPLSGGDLRVRFNASHYRETLADQTQRSGGVELEWETRPGLILEGSVQTIVLTAPRQEISPTNMEFRGIWRF